MNSSLQEISHLIPEDRRRRLLRLSPEQLEGMALSVGSQTDALAYVWAIWRKAITAAKALPDPEAELVLDRAEALCSRLLQQRDLLASPVLTVPRAPYRAQGSEAPRLW